MKPPVILITGECHSRLCRKVTRLLANSGFVPISVFNLRNLKSEVHRHQPAVAVCVSHQRDPDEALKPLSIIQKTHNDLPTILIADQSSELLAIAALRAGIDDYFKNPFSDADLLSSCRKWVRNRKPPKSSDSEGGCLTSTPEDPMVGNSPAMQEIKAYIANVARTDSTVLITGETGTGKELAAEWIHSLSLRKIKPLVRVNCSAMPDGLVESELFGYDRGAFTGAVGSRKGKFELARGGSLFLDEIGDMSTYAQAKILRSIETKAVSRLGGNGEIPVDVRVIAATNQEPEELISGRKFREDLYYRLNVARLHLPPLRERKQDIPLLVDFAIEHLNRRFRRSIQCLTQPAMEILLQYEWPGNVRELINILEATYINLPRGRIDCADLPKVFRKKLEDSRTLPLQERHRIVAALLETKWNKSSAAQKLNWSRMTLYRKITKYNIVEKRNPPR